MANKIRSAVHGLLAIGACVVAYSQSTVASETYSFNIPAEEGPAAIRDFGLQSGIAVLAKLEDLQGIRTNPVSGSMSVDAALKQLVAGTGLHFAYMGHSISLTMDPAPRHNLSANQPVGQALPASSAREDIYPEPAMLLEEIVVTAQRRDENLQNVPISAQVVEGQTLIEQNLNSLDDLSEVMPSVHVGSNSRSANLYIRGTGSGESQNFEQSVGIFEDDIYHGRARMSNVMLFDLERIEVLKGPQTTFFGNNAIAGAFNIVTKQPTDEPDSSVRGLYGQDGQYTAEAAIGGPIAETLSARLALMTDGQTGWLNNQSIGRDVPGENNVGGRLTLLFSPSNDLDATLKIEGSRNRNVGSLALQDGNCPPPSAFTAAGFCKTAVSLGIPTGLDNNTIAQNAGQQILLDTGEYVLKVNYHWLDQTLTAVSGFYDYHFDENEDADGTPVNLLNIQEPEHFHQFSEELRITSPADQRLEYLAGLYYHTNQLSFSHDDSDFFLTPTLEAKKSFSPLVPYLPLGQDMNFSQAEKSYSVFASTTWRLTDELSWSTGLRASWVKKSYDWNLFYGTAAAPYGSIIPLPPSEAALAQIFANAAGLGAATTLSGSRDDHALMPSSQIQYELTPQANFYFSYAKGWKAGGFNGGDTTGIASNLPFSPEQVDAYEAGLKSEWFDHKVRINLDIFRSDYTDLQVATNLASATGAIVSLVRNVAASRSQGVELDLEWVLFEGLRLSADVTYDDSRYRTYPDVAPTQLQQLLGETSQNLAGRPTEFAPTWSGTLVGSYAAKFYNYRLTTRIAGIASSSYYLTGNDDPTVEQTQYFRLDARTSLETADGHWALDVIGKNLTNRDILTFGINWPTALGSTWLQKEEPRNIAVQLRFRW